MRFYKFIALLGLCISTQALGFNGVLTASMSDNSKKQEGKTSFGLVMSQPLVFGLGWWSWSGFGTTFQPETSNHWMSTTQGLDLTFNKYKVGATAKFEYDPQSKDATAEYGIRLNVKLW